MVSFVVDSLPIHYYQAELLLFSLERYAGYPKENILVQCTNSVENKFIQFLEKNKYNYCLVEPYLDKKYCNKIAQLDALLPINCDGVFLLDTDLFILGALGVPDWEKFCAKIVDAANPPLSVIGKIFEASGVELPGVIDTDIVTVNSKTIATNFNGGFYYIPQYYLETVREYWRKWAEWLFDRQDLFDTKQQCNHIDQVSMALCIAESKTSYAYLDANSNFPVNTLIKPTSYLENKEISVLHYHRFVENSDVIRLEHKPIHIVANAIKKANQAIKHRFLS